MSRRSLHVQRQQDRNEAVEPEPPPTRPPVVEPLPPEPEEPEPISVGSLADDFIASVPDPVEEAVEPLVEDTPPEEPEL